MSARKRASRKALPRLIFAWAGVAALGGLIWLAWPGDAASREGGPYDQGLSLLRSGSFGEAAGRFRELVDRDPGNALWHRYLGESLLRGGERGAGIAALTRALELDPDLTDAAKLLARAAMKDGNDAVAVKLLEEVLRKRTDPEAQADLGVLYLRGGRVSEGIDTFEAALRYELRPPPMEEALDVAELIRRRGRLLGRADEDSRARPIFQKVLLWIQATGGGDSGDPVYAAPLARVNLGLGRAKEARHWAQEALKGADNRTRADMHMVLARLSASLGIEDEVEGHVEAATLAERTAGRYADIASFWEEVGREDRVLQTFDTGRFWLPDDLSMLVLWAEGYARAGRSAEALAGLRERPALFGDRPSYHRALARVLRSAGRLDEAAEVLAKARERFPDDSGVEADALGARLDLAALDGLPGPELESLVQEARDFSGKARGDPALRSIEARALLCAGNTAPALEILRDVHRADPVRLDWALDFGRGCFLSGKLGEAGEVLSDALARTGADLPQYRRMHVESLYRSGLLQRALQAGRALVARNSRDLSSRWLTGRILLALREFGAAESEFSKLVLLSGDDPRLLLGRQYARQAARMQGDLGLACLQARETAGSKEELLNVVAAEDELRAQAHAIRTAEGILADQIPSLVDVADFFYALGLREEALSLYRREMSRTPGDVGLIRRICEYTFDAWRDFTEVDDGIAKLRDRTPDLLDLRYLRGRRECLAGEPADGIRLLESYLEVRAADWRARLALGRAYVRQGQPLEALDHVLAARRLRPYHEGIRQVLGEVVMSEAARLHDGGSVGALRELCRKVLGHVPGSTGDGLPITRMLLALAEAGGSLEVRMAMAGDDAGRGEGFLVIGALLLARGDARGAREHFARAAELDPGGSLGHHLLAAAAIECGDLEAALESARAAETAADSPAAALEIAAAVLIRMGRIDEAKTRARACLVETTERAAVELVLARALSAGGDTEASLEVLEGSLKAEPGSLGALDALVRLVRKRSGAVAALQLVSARVEGAPRDPALAVFAGEHLLEAGEESLAAHYLERSLDLNPEDRDAALLLALACRRGGDLDGELRALAAALLRDPRDADALLLMGELHVRAGRTEPAVESYSDCLSSRPDSLEARLSLIGVLQQASGGLDDAERVAEAGLARDPGDPRMLFASGSVLLESGRPGEARELFARAVAGYQGTAPAPEGGGPALIGVVHRRPLTAADIRVGRAHAEKALAAAREQE